MTLVSSANFRCFTDYSPKVQSLVWKEKNGGEGTNPLWRLVLMATCCCLSVRKLGSTDSWRWAQ